MSALIDLSLVSVARAARALAPFTTSIVPFDLAHAHYRDQQRPSRLHRFPAGLRRIGRAVTTTPRRELMQCRHHRNGNPARLGPSHLHLRSKAIPNLPDAARGNNRSRGTHGQNFDPREVTSICLSGICRHNDRLQPASLITCARKFHRAARLAGRKYGGSSGVYAVDKGFVSGHDFQSCRKPLNNTRGLQPLRDAFFLFSPSAAL